jgi:hypothetical protein
VIRRLIEWLGLPSEDDAPAVNGGAPVLSDEDERAWAEAMFLPTPPVKRFVVTTRRPDGLECGAYAGAKHVGGCEWGAQAALAPEEPT